MWLMEHTKPPHDKTCNIACPPSEDSGQHGQLPRICRYSLTEKEMYHHENMSVYCIPPYTPLLYSKTGVYRGIHDFLIFALKQKLWVLVRTAHNICFEQKYENSKKKNQLKLSFLQSLYIAWACFRNDF